MIVYNSEEAMNWFLKNAKGVVVCRKGNQELICNCYPVAKSFFEENKNKEVNNE